jgi:hypothetical protein
MPASCVSSLNRVIHKPVSVASVMDCSCRKSSKDCRADQSATERNASEGRTLTYRLRKIVIDLRNGPEHNRAASFALRPSMKRATKLGRQNNNTHQENVDRPSKTPEGKEDSAAADSYSGLDAPSGKRRRPWTQYRRVVFIFGCLLGLVLAWAARSPDIQLDGLLDSMDIADFFDDLKAALPSTLPIGLVREAREIQEHSRQTAATAAFSVGEQMAHEGMKAHYPVVMVLHRFQSFTFPRFLA